MMHVDFRMTPVFADFGLRPGYRSHGLGILQMDTPLSLKKRSIPEIPKTIGEAENKQLSVQLRIYFFGHAIHQIHSSA